MEAAAQHPVILARCRPASGRARAGAAPAFQAPPGPAVVFSIAAAKCNRCGACLRLGCPAISDEGGDALVVDPLACTGCAACEPQCRARAIAPIG